MCNTRYARGYIDLVSGDKHGTNRPGFERESTQLSDDFERHTQVTRHLELHPEERTDRNYDDDNEIDMDDPNVEKAATRIQASFRGYQTRKVLGTTSQTADDHRYPPMSDELSSHQQHHGSNSRCVSFYSLAC
jgi:hypothetical protein